MTMEIEVLVVPNCPHEAAAVELIAAAVTDTGLKATIIHTTIASEDQARQRGFIG